MNYYFQKMVPFINRYHNIMNIFGKIILVIVLMLLAGHTSFAQTRSQQNDTLNSKMKKMESNVNSKDQNSKEVNNNQPDKGNNDTESQSVKQVRAARPDMSKARGARPPDIVRPTGSRIPNGIGKPAGAKRPGH
jgi:hypothetical protein